MPTIREYQQTVAPAGPGAVINAPLAIADAAATKGRALGEAMSQTGALVQDIGERIDKSRIQANQAVVRAELTVEMQKAVESGLAATPDFAQKFSERVAERVEQDSKQYRTFAGTQMAANASASLAAEFKVQANHYQAVAVGQQAALAHTLAVDRDAITLQQDPQQLQSVLNSYLSMVQDPNGNFVSRLPKQKLDELIQHTTEKFGMAAMRGAINISPELAAENMKEGKGGAELLSADQRTQMIAEIDRGFRDREVEDERRIRLQAREEAKAQEVTMLDFQRKLAAPGGPTLSIPEITNSNLTSVQQEHYKRLVKEGVGQTDPSVMLAVYRGIRSGKITEWTQLDPYLGRGLTYPDMQHLRKELQFAPTGASKLQAMNTASRLFAGSGILGNQLGELNWNRDLTDRWQKKVEAKEDPTVLIRDFPGNKENMLTIQAIQDYTISVWDKSKVLMDEANAGRAAAQAEMAKGGGNLPRIKSVKELDALPPGAWFINASTGRLARKPPALPVPTE